MACDVSPVAMFEGNGMRTSKTMLTCKYTNTVSVKVADRPLQSVFFQTVFLQSKPGLRIFEALRVFFLQKQHPFK